MKKYYVIFHREDNFMIFLFSESQLYSGNIIGEQIETNIDIQEYIQEYSSVFAIPISKKEFYFLKGKQYRSQEVLDWKEKRFPELML